MTRLFVILFRLFSGLFILIIVAFSLAYYLLGQSLPEYDKALDVAGTTGRVEIIRDNHAVPHIFAEAEPDLYFGLGFAHAQDRLWQMLVLRRTVQGRLSELFGEDTLPIDSLLRTLDLYGVSRAALAHQSADTVAVLQAYAAGVNAQIHTVREEALGRGAPELFLFSPDIAPWTPTDSLAIMRLMALQLTDKAANEVLQARVTLGLPPERVRDLFPDDQGAAILDLPDFAEMFDMERPMPAQPAIEHALYPLRKPGFAGASNAFAAAPSRTATDGALLANDPHMAFSAPSIWMLARLQFPEGGVIGGTIPGLPAILIGRNSDFGWGLTTSYLDDQDIFVEKLNPENPEEYLTPTGHRAFDRRDVIINVKDQPGVTVQVRTSRHGPVIGAEHWGLSAILPPGHVAALAWTALDPQEQTMDAVLGLMRARSVEEAQPLLAKVAFPAQNVVMADKSHIAIQTTGHAPRRDRSHSSLGRIPAPGWLAQNDWSGYLPFATNPASVNPAGGIVVNTNNRLTDKPFPNHWSFDWGDNQRIQRAERLLNGREFHTLDSFIEIQTDDVSPSARVLVPLIAKDLWWSGQPAATGTIEKRRQDALELLANWNGEMSEHDTEPLIYAAWVRALQRRLLVDELGPLAEEFLDVRPLFIERVYKDVDGAAIWCDVRQTSRAEDCTEIARVALDEALLILSEKYGDKLESWRWGDAHQALQKHGVLGNIPLLRWFVNIRQDTPGGDNTLMRGRTLGRGSEPFLNIHGAGLRVVFDFSDPEASVFIMSTGQSGHFLSRHYDDLAQIWRRSEYIPMTLDPILARGGNLGVTVLRPVTE